MENDDIEFVKVLNPKQQREKNNWDDCDIDDEEVLQQESITSTLPISPFGLKRPDEIDMFSKSQFSNIENQDNNDDDLKEAMSPQIISQAKFQFKQSKDNEIKIESTSECNENLNEQKNTLIFLTDPNQYQKTIDFLEYNIKSHYNFINDTYDFIQHSYQSKNRLTKINILFTLRQIQLSFIMNIRDSILFKKPFEVPDYKDFISSQMKESIVNKLDQIINEISVDTVNLQNIIIQIVNGVQKNQFLKELEILFPDEIQGLKQRLSKYAKKLWDSNLQSKYKSQNEIIISQLLMVCLSEYSKINKYLSAIGYSKIFDKKFMYPRFHYVLQILTSAQDQKKFQAAFQCFQ